MRIGGPKLILGVLLIRVPGRLNKLTFLGRTVNTKIDHTVTHTMQVGEIIQTFPGLTRIGVSGRVTV